MVILLSFGTSFGLHPIQSLMLVSMDMLMMQPKSIQTKADALHFAIIATMKHECGRGSYVDYEEAKKLFQFFCDNVTFSQDETIKMLDLIQPIIQDALSRTGGGAMIHGCVKE